MKHRFVAVPEGKIVKSRAGNYMFVGPCFVSLSDKFLLPATYLDGDPLVYTSEKVMPNEPESNSKIPNSSQSRDHSEGRSGREDSGESSGDVRTAGSVHECTCEGDCVTGVHGECLNASKHGLGCGTHLPCDVESDKPSSDATEGGLDSDKLGNKAKRVRKPKSDPGTTALDNDAGW